MKRLAPVAGATLVAGSLTLLVALAFLVAPEDAAVPERAASEAAPGGPASRVRPQVDPVARRLLERAAAAPTTTAYRGTQFVSAWTGGLTTARVIEVTHDPAGGTTWRGGWAGPGQQVRNAAATAPSLLAAGAVELLAGHYSIVAAGGDRVAGRDVDVVEAARPGVSGPARVAARFWLDRSSGLVLRREVYDRRGRPTRASAFIDIEIDLDSRAAQDGASGADAGDSGWADTLDGAEVARLRERGWTCPDALPGPLPLVDARRSKDGGGTLHLSYADGIASISVFQQRGRLDPDQLTGYRRETVGGHEVWERREVPRRVVWSTGGRVYTVVADAPRRTVDQAISVLYVDSDGRDGGRMDRLGRGLDRVASWFNPID